MICIWCHWSIASIWWIPQAKYVRQNEKTCYFKEALSQVQKDNLASTYPGCRIISSFFLQMSAPHPWSRIRHLNGAEPLLPFPIGSQRTFHDYYKPFFAILVCGLTVINGISVNNLHPGVGWAIRRCSSFLRVNETLPFVWTKSYFGISADDWCGFKCGCL